MTPEKILEKINAIAQHLPENDKKAFDFCRQHPNDVKKIYNSSGALLAELMFEAEADIRRQAAKANGNGSRQKAAEKFIKDTKKAFPHMLGIHGAHIKNDTQYFTNSHIAFALPQPLPLENSPENAEPLDVKRFIDNAKKNEGEKLTLPTVAELKAYIKIEKAKKQHRILWDFGDNLPLVDARYLLTVLEIIPDPVAVASGKGPLYPLYFASYHGEALLMPCRR